MWLFTLPISLVVIYTETEIKYIHFIYFVELRWNAINYCNNFILFYYNQTFDFAGDDCISIQTGCTGVYVHNVNCGPGHGISIGGLGKDGTKACVSNVTVRDSTIKNTLNGVRIKTWQVGFTTETLNRVFTLYDKSNR